MRSLSRLFKPKSVALVGGAWAANVLEQLQKSGFDGGIWPVHPSQSELRGVPCYNSLDKLPGTPDAAFIGVNRKASVGIVSQLSKMGAGGATCFASGFLESEQENSGGASLQSQLVEAAGDMPVLGPNCYGMLNYVDNVTLWPDQHGGRPCKTGVAIIGQSSNILINITMQKRSLPIAYAIAAGNQAQTGFSQIASHLLEDERVTAIGLYIEGFGDLREFEAFAAKARKAGKPVIAIKSGKSEKSRIATLTHTASLAGGATAASAFMARLGIIEVGSIETFLETLKLVHQFGALPGKMVSSVSCSGGEAGFMSDMAEGSDIAFRDFTKKATEKLKDVLGPIVTIANPLDYHTYIWGDRDAMTATYSTVFDDGFDLNLVVMDIPPADRCDMTAWQAPLQAVVDASCKTNANVALMATLPENLSEEIGDWLMENGVAPVHGMATGIEAVSAAIRAGNLFEFSSEPVFVAERPQAKTVTLSEVQAKKALAQYGVNFPVSYSATTPEEAVLHSQKLGFPVVLKGLGIAHKTDAGAVALGLASANDVHCAAQAMAGVNGYLVEEMVKDAVAEILVGVTRDETGLFLLTIGAGGTLTELLSDSTSLIVPATRLEIGQAIETLRVSNILAGYRGKPSADTNSLLDTITSIQNYVMQNPQVTEIDINPIQVLKTGAVAVDALIVEEEKS